MGTFVTWWQAHPPHSSSFSVCGRQDLIKLVRLLKDVQVKKISNGKEETAEGGLLEGSCRTVLMSWTLRSLLHNEGKVIIILVIVIIVVINRKINLWFIIYLMHRYQTYFYLQSIAW